MGTGARPLASATGRRSRLRIGHAATTLLLSSGLRKLTVAEIAAEAGVGKGTMYLYWPSKEKLFADLLVGEARDSLDEVLALVGDVSGQLTIGGLARLVTASVTRRPLMRYMLGHTDADLDRLLADRALFDGDLRATDPKVLCLALLPALRQHGLVRIDGAASDQAFTLNAVLLGFVASVVSVDRDGAPDARFGELLESTVDTLFGPSTPPAPQDIEEAGKAVARILTDLRDKLAEDESSS